MLEHLIAAATATPTPSPSPSSTHDAYDWWSDIWLPLLVGAGSVFIAAVAVRLASRSNRLAAAATQAAERSNAIAKRAIELEDKRAQRAQEREDRLERQAFADRYLRGVQEVVDELAADPHWWDRARPDPSPQLGRLSALRYEAIVLRYFDFPGAEAMDFIQVAGSAHVGHGIVMSAYSYAHALVNKWARQDGPLDKYLSYWNEQLQQEIDEAASRTGTTE